MKKTSILSAGISFIGGNSFLHFTNDSLQSLESADLSKDTVMEKTFAWTYNIVSSCNNDFHFDCADALISLFAQKYGESEMLFQLKQLRQYKWHSVHSILN